MVHFQQDLELSFVALDIGGDKNGSGAPSSSNPCFGSVEQASCSIFVDDDEDEMDM